MTGGRPARTSALVGRVVVRLSDGTGIGLHSIRDCEMKRAREVKTAGHWDHAGAIDSIVLDAHDRHRRRVVLTGERGTTFLLDLPQAMSLRDGDGLVLDDGGIVRIVGRLEPLIEITATNTHELTRLAWHIGNRHIDVQMVGDRL